MRFYPALTGSKTPMIDVLLYNLRKVMNGRGGLKCLTHCFYETSLCFEEN